MTLAWIRQAWGDAAGAMEAMLDAERIAPSPSVAGLFNPVPAQRAGLLLAQGDVVAAARWTGERGLSADEPIYQKEREHLVLARVLLAQDHPARALALLERLLAAAAAQGRTGSRSQLGLGAAVVEAMFGLYAIGLIPGGNSASHGLSASSACVSAHCVHLCGERGRLDDWCSAPRRH